jgi:diketogulonate reductase-like aldo/keto reductase
VLKTSLEYKTFSPAAQRVSEIGLGTFYDMPWMMGARLGWKRDLTRRVEAIRTGLSGGINLVDTAESYNSEPLVQEAIDGFKREDLFIATKITFIHLGRKAMQKAINGSLRRLKTNYVDLYQIHQPSPFGGIREAMIGMEELVEAGKIRAIGVSNFSLKQTIEASTTLKNVRLASTQMSYSLLNRSIEKDIIPYCRKEGIAVLAYYPLGHGRLANEKQKLRSICEKYSKTPAQVALNWLASQPGVFPIPRASNPVHVQENFGASGWRLSEEDLRELDVLFPGPIEAKTGRASSPSAS